MVWLLTMTWNIPVCYFNHTHPNGQRIWWLWHWTPPLLDPILWVHVTLGGGRGDGGGGGRRRRRRRWWFGSYLEMMDTLDNSSLFFLQMFTQHQLGLKPLSITPPPPSPSTPPPAPLPPPSLSNELFSSGDGTGTQSNVINNLLFSFTNWSVLGAGIKVRMHPRRTMPFIWHLSTSHNRLPQDE